MHYCTCGHKILLIYICIHDFGLYLSIGSYLWTSHIIFPKQTDKGFPISPTTPLHTNALQTPCFLFIVSHSWLRGGAIYYVKHSDRDWPQGVNIVFWFSKKCHIMIDCLMKFFFKLKIKLIITRSWRYGQLCNDHVFVLLCVCVLSPLHLSGFISPLSTKHTSDPQSRNSKILATGVSFR